jgi:hypothetical protein
MKFTPASLTRKNKMGLSLLLNWRVWATAALVASYVCVGYLSYHTGANSVLVEFEAYKTTQLADAVNMQRAVRAKEQDLITKTHQVSQDYAALKSSTDDRIRSLDAERLRLQATISALHSGGTAAPAQAGPSADESPEDRVLGACVQQYDAVAGDAQSLSDQVTALQAYVNAVTK